MRYRGETNGPALSDYLHLDLLPPRILVRLRISLTLPSLILLPFPTPPESLVSIIPGFLHISDIVLNPVNCGLIASVLADVVADLDSRLTIRGGDLDDDIQGY